VNIQTTEYPHRHKCSACAGSDLLTCECDTPESPSNCDERIPAERSMQCSLAQTTGREKITQLMVEEYRRAEQWHDGIDFI
jgi:hypothetical protein